MLALALLALTSRGGDFAIALETLHFGELRQLGDEVVASAQRIHSAAQHVHARDRMIHLLLIVEVLADLFEQRQRLTGDLADL